MLIILLGVLLVLANLLVTIGLLRSDTYEPRQKLRNVMVIWLLPVAGALLVRNALREASLDDFYDSGQHGKPVDFGYPDIPDIDDL